MLEVGNIPVAQAGDEEDSQWALKNEMGLTLSAYMFQGRLEGDRFGFKSGDIYFEEGKTDSLIHIMKKVGGEIIDRGTLGGSMSTDTFYYTKPLGGLMYRDSDGEAHYSIRTSPTGSGTAVAVGNYDNPLYIANKGGALLVSPNGSEERRRVLQGDTTSFTSGKRFTANIKVSNPEMVYGGDIYLQTPVELDTTYIYRAWAEGEDGRLLHDNITAEEFSYSDDVEELERLGAGVVVFKAGESSVYLPLSTSMPITDYGGVYDIKIGWEFKQVVTISGVAGDDIKYNADIEKGTIERVASQEWVTHKISAQGSPTSYRLVDNTATGDDLVILNGEDILVSYISEDMEFTIGDTVDRFTIRDLGEFIAPRTVKVKLSNTASLTLDNKCDYVSVFKTSQSWAYYDHRLQASFTISNVPDSALIGG